MAPCTASRCINRLAKSVIRNSDGSLHSEQMYKPFGEKRYPTGASTLPTTYRYTGQRSETGLGPAGGEGLMFYGARWYDSQLGRFLSADSIIPGAGNPQAWDRYAGLLNKPIRYTDPSGHATCTDDGYCGKNPRPIETELAQYGVTLGGDWDENDKLQVLIEVIRMGAAIACLRGNCSSFSAASGFRNIMGDWNIKMDKNAGNYCEAGTGTITCHGGTNGNLSNYGFAGTITHEYGHVLDNQLGGAGTDLMESSGIYDVNRNWVTGLHTDTQRDYERTTTGYGCDRVPCMMHPLDWLPDGPTASEEFADMWMNYVQDSFAANDAGVARYDFMDDNLPILLGY
jgi:RHS repeat-associated protein